MSKALNLKTAVDPDFEAEKEGVLLWKVTTAEQLKITHPSEAHFSLKIRSTAFFRITRDARKRLTSLYPTGNFPQSDSRRQGDAHFLSVGLVVSVESCAHPRFVPE